MSRTPSESRYENMTYNRCGNSGLLLPAISLGLWHNFGHVDDYENGREMVLRSFDLGITHFDLANNYGPPPGSAEENFGRILKQELAPYRDELIISTKAGYTMWPGPYGDFGSRKYLTASLDQSLKRMGLEYVDVFYSHRMDCDTPLEETMGALDKAVRDGKALYAGISNYSPERTVEAARILKEMGTPCLIHQMVHSMLNRDMENRGLFDVLEEQNIGSINFSPLAQGMLTNKYLGGDIPAGSRASKEHGFLKTEAVTREVLQKVDTLNQLAQKRGQSLAQMAIAWCLGVTGVTSVLVGASRVSQMEDNVKALENTAFSAREIRETENILNP